ncbi:2132_t:CDS:2, partial [Acaulospora colombiana]
MAKIIADEQEYSHNQPSPKRVLNDEHIESDGFLKKRRSADDYRSTLPNEIMITNEGTSQRKRYDNDFPPCDEEDFSSDSDSEIIETSVELKRILDQTVESDAPRTPPPRQAQIQFNNEDNDLHDQDRNENASTEVQDENENASIEVQDLITKMENVDHRLFEYRIVNLSEKSLIDPVNKVFSDDDKKRMRKFWEEMEPSVKEKQNTLRRPRWEKSIKPLIDKYALAVEVKPESVFDEYVQPPPKIIFEIPFEGEFDFKKHYDLLWVQDIYRRFMFLFAISFNMLRDANTLEVAYRESFVNPKIPKAFEDVNDKI